MFRVVLTVFLAVFLSATVFSVELKLNPSEYPHWNLNDPEIKSKAEKINEFIEKNRDKGYIAVFDWDGTLYNEIIPCRENIDPKTGKPIIMCGQAGYLIWASKQFKNDSIFPSYSTAMKQNFMPSKAVAVKTMVNFLEGHTNASQENPAHTFLYGTFFSGMTPRDVAYTVDRYLQVREYSPEMNMFYPVFDVLQKFLDSGYQVYIITGSNEYLVSKIMNSIENNRKTSYGGRQYSFPDTLSGIPYVKEGGHIIGNSPYLNSKGNFSNVSDNHWSANKKNDLCIIDGIGKQYVIENLEKLGGKVVFAAGNSNGDYFDTNYVISKPYDTLALAVNPRGDKYSKLVRDNNEKIVEISTEKINK